jgi:exo-beta-1,3-glucanase (GH17 family)
MTGSPDQSNNPNMLAWVRSRAFIFTCLLGLVISMIWILLKGIEPGSSAFQLFQIDANAQITVIPDQMVFSGDVVTKLNCTNLTVCSWLEGSPPGSIIIGVDPASTQNSDWDGGSAAATFAFTDIFSPTVATVRVSWPEQDGKGIHSPVPDVLAEVLLDDLPIWKKQALTPITYGDYYAAQNSPIAFTFLVTQPVTHTLTFRVPDATAWDISEITIETNPLPEILRGVAYSPYRNCQSPILNIFPTMDEIEADMAFLAHNANGIRTYNSCGIHDRVYQYAQKYGLPVAAGAWLGPDLAENEKQITCLINATKEYSTIQSVIVGSEVLLRKDLTEAQLLDYIRRVKAQVNVPVTTADIWVTLENHPALIQASDYILIHIYSFWDAWWGGAPFNNSAEYVVDIYQNYQHKYPEKKVVIGETGWPSHGEGKNLGIPTPKNQCQFYTDFLQLAAKENVEFYYFSFFEEPWKKGEEDGDVGEYWGVNYTNRSAKYNLQGFLLQGSIFDQERICDLMSQAVFLPQIVNSQKQTTAPTSTPRPTVAPTPTLTPTWQAFKVFEEHTSTNNHFIPSGMMGDVDDIGLYDCCQNDPQAGKDAIKVNYSAEKSRGLGWASVYWQEPEGNWGQLPGGYNLTGVTALTFWAKGEQGDEQVEFFTGGLWRDQCEAFRNIDSIQPAATTDVLTLTREWKQYSLDLRGKNLTKVIGGFGFATNTCFNPSGAIFYLDNIQYVYGDIKTPPSPTATPSVPYSFTVYADKDIPGSHYLPDALMGDIADLHLDECWREDTHSGLTAIKLEYDATGSGGNNWTAMGWTHPGGNWGDRPGGYDLSGAKDLCFWAKGAQGGEQINFKFGGMGYEPDTCTLNHLTCGQVVSYPDSVCPVQSSTVITLTDQWQEYCLPIYENVDLSHVVGGFLWAADRSQNPNGAIFYLDDISYKFNIPAHAKPVYMGASLSSGYDMGVSASFASSLVVQDEVGSICMDYNPGGGALSWGSAFITVGPPVQPPRPGQNLSGYHTLSLELKGDLGGENVAVGLKDNTDPDNGSEVKLNASGITTDWQTFSFPLASFTTADLTQLYVVTEFVLSGEPAQRVCFRNIQYLP